MKKKYREPAQDLIMSMSTWKSWYELLKEGRDVDLSDLFYWVEEGYLDMKTVYKKGTKLYKFIRR